LAIALRQALDFENGHGREEERIGVLEYWSIGVLGFPRPLLHQPKIFTLSLPDR
jgi:hypothetical protein